MDVFLPVKDELSQWIQEQSALLYQKLRNLNVDALGMPYYCQEYFKGSHFKRLFFSIETSAHLLYHSVTLSGKPVKDIVLMDYGAGVGTLYTLAKMIGCGKVIYNDHLPDWKQSAQLIAEAIGVTVDAYITGDIDDTLSSLSAQKIECDIIVSRNVIEHIYQLDSFYSAIAIQQPRALIYSSTTANYKNPGSRIQHWLLHRKWEKVFSGKRESFILSIEKNLAPSITRQLVAATKGMAYPEIRTALEQYRLQKTYPSPLPIGSNTCDPENGVWAEHMISFSGYKKMIGETRYDVSFLPGFWDTHYSKKWKNILGRILNLLIQTNKSAGIYIAPFIYVVARKKPGH